MTYFYHRKLLSCYLREPIENVCDCLIIEYEFTHSSQDDGHAPWHRDDQRSFAESVIRNIPLEPIMECLDKNNIKGFKSSYCSIKVTKTERFESYMPVYLMEVRISFSREEDSSRFVAEQFVDSVPWQVAKQGIYSGESYSGNWEFGRNGK